MSKKKLVIIVLVLAAGVPLLLALYRAASNGILERVAPQIEFVEIPRGIGVIPVRLQIALKDAGTGLDEVVVRARQKRNTREIVKKKLAGSTGELLVLDFNGKDSGFEPGELSIDVRVFDRSYWSNQSEQTLNLKVDYRRPELEVLTTQHNAQAGGSQVVFYRATDENLALSGVRVGNHRFPGYPARGLDELFTDPSVFVAIYGIDPTVSGEVALFAEDSVGNASAANFYNKVLARQWGSKQETLTDRYLQRVKEQFGSRVISGEKTFANILTLSQEEDRARLSAELAGPRFERLWEGAFIQQSGAAKSAYGDYLTYLFEGKEIARTRLDGYEIKIPAASPQVLAANKGVVTFAGNIGTYGVTVVIDHGLGLATAYSQLSSSRVERGATVEKGDVIGLAGTSGLGRENSVFFRFMVNGLPVDAREWWDRSWVQTHLEGKIEEAKRILGIPVYRKLDF